MFLVSDVGMVGECCSTREDLASRQMTQVSTDVMVWALISISIHVISQRWIFLMTLNKIISKRFHNFNIDVQMGTSSSTNTIRLGMLGCILVGFEVETLKKNCNYYRQSYRLWSGSNIWWSWILTVNYRKSLQIYIKSFVVRLF